MIGGAARATRGDNGPAIEASLDTPGGIAVAPNGDVYFADSNNHVIRRIDARNNITTVAGNNALRRGFRRRLRRGHRRRSSIRPTVWRSLPTAT